MCSIDDETSSQERLQRLVSELQLLIQTQDNGGDDWRVDRELQLRNCVWEMVNDEDPAVKLLPGSIRWIVSETETVVELNGADSDGNYSVRIPLAGDSGLPHLDLFDRFIAAATLEQIVADL